MKTKAGVYYNLYNSNYTCTYFGVEFFFSSELHKYNFESRLNEHTSRINASLTNRFGFLIDSRFVAAMNLYIKTETRGFLIQLPDGKFVEKASELILISGEVRSVSNG